MRFKGEKQDLEYVHSIANKWGYGNLIQFLKEKWALHLMQDGISAEAAALGAEMNKREAKLFSQGYRLP